MNVYRVSYKKYSETKIIHVGAANVAKAQEVAAKYLKRNEYAAGEITEITKTQSLEAFAR